MIPNVYKFDGHEINDGTNYTAFFEGKENSFFRQADGPTRELARADHTPVGASIDMLSKLFKVVINPVGTFHSQVNTLNQWFDTHDPDFKVFIIKDTADSSRQWYVMARPESIVKARPDEFIVLLKAVDPIWRTVSANSETWSPTASAQTNVFTIRGNRPVKPVISLTPTVAKVGGYAERMFRCWYNPMTTENYDNHPLDVVNHAWDTTGLVSNASISNQINEGAGITAAATSFNVDVPVGGGLATTGGVLYVDTEQIKYSSIAAGLLTVSTDGRGWGGTTAATHADNAVCTQSRMLANGADIQVYVDKKKVSRWVYHPNTSTTKVFIASNFEAGCSLELNEVIAGTGAITTIKFKLTREGIEAAEKLGKMGTFLLVIGSEVFTGTGVDIFSQNITGITRAEMSSSMAAHAVEDVIYFVEHEIWVAWGDLSMVGTKDFTGGTQDETHKPMIDMDNSTNTSWRYLEFWDDDALRAGAWKPEVAAGRSCKVLGGSHTADADPATEIGMIGQVYEIGGQPRANSYILRATLFHPSGFTSITCNGDKYRYSADWAKVAGLYAGDNMVMMASLFNLATPSTAKSWTAWTQTAVAIGTKKYIQFRLEGNVSNAVDNMHVMEVQTITTLAISSTNVLQLAFSGAAISAYEFGREATGTPARLKNDTNGEYIDISFIGELNETLKIDCDAEWVKYMKNNTRADGAIDYPARDHIFQMDPGTDGNNTLSLTDAGLAGVTVLLTWEDRNS